jgi:hypothetical protein
MTRQTTRPTRTALVATGVVVALASTALAGCTRGGGSQTGTTSKAAAHSAVPTPDAIVNDPKARPSVSMKSCAATTSGWTAGGTVTNSKAKESTFTIVVSFTTKQSTVLARGQTRVIVKAGATKSWATSANFAKTKGTQCVLRGVAES